jgi:hypothetical protein
VLAGVAGLALVIGVGRSGFQAMGLASRYSLLTWPALAVVYLVWAGQPSLLGQRISTSLGLAALTLFPFNTCTGLVIGWQFRDWMDRTEMAAQAGESTEEIVVEHLTGTNQEDRAMRGIPMLKDAGVSFFASPGTRNPKADPIRSLLAWGSILAATGLLLLVLFVHRRLPPAPVQQEADGSNQAR